MPLRKKERRGCDRALGGESGISLRFKLQPKPIAGAGGVGAERAGVREDVRLPHVEADVAHGGAERGEPVGQVPAGNGDLVKHLQGLLQHNPSGPPESRAPRSQGTTSEREREPTGPRLGRVVAVASTRVALAQPTGALATMPGGIRHTSGPLPVQARLGR